MNPTQLAGLVKRAYPNFDMTNFNDRLKLQKLIYLMQESNINLGYDFGLYLHGPYAKMLARDGFDMPNFDKCKIIKFEDSKLDEKFESLLKFLDNKKDDKDAMEIIASLHLFHKIYPRYDDSEKSPEFSSDEENIKKLLNELKQFDGIKW